MNGNELLIIGASSSRNLSNFVIYDMITRTTRPHPYFQASGKIEAALYVGDGTFYIAGQLGFNEESIPLGGLAICQPNVYCSPIYDGPSPLQALFNPSFQSCEGSILLWDSPGAGSPMWVLTPGGVWKQLTGNLEPLLMNCIEGSLYVMSAPPGGDIYTSLCNNKITPYGNSYFLFQVRNSSCLMLGHVDLLGQGITENLVFLVDEKIVVSGLVNYSLPIPKVKDWWPETLYAYEDQLLVQYQDKNDDSMLYWYSEDQWHVYGGDVWNPYWVGGQLWVFASSKDRTFYGGLFEASDLPPDSINMTLYGIPSTVYDGCGVTKEDMIAVIFVLGQNLIQLGYQGTDLLSHSTTHFFTKTRPAIKCLDKMIITLVHDFNITVYTADEVFTLPYPQEYDLLDLTNDGGDWLAAFEDETGAVFLGTLGADLVWSIQPTPCPILRQQLLTLFVDSRLYLVTVDFHPTITIWHPVDGTNGTRWDNHTLSHLYANPTAITAGPDDTILLGGIFYQYPSESHPKYLIMRYDLHNRTEAMTVVRIQENQDGLHTLHYADGQVYFTTVDTKQAFAGGYMATLSGQDNLVPVPLPMASPISFFGPIVPDIPAPPLDLGDTIAKMVCLSVGALLIAVVLVFENRRRIKRFFNSVESVRTEYVQIPAPLEQKFGQEMRGKVVGKGSFGTVTTARHPNGGMYAAKYIYLREPHLKELALQEIHILKQLQHTNTIRLRDYTQSEMEIVIYTDLFDTTLPDIYLRRRLSCQEVVTVACGMARGLQYIHSLNIVHRDIKPTNVVVTVSGYNEFIEVVHLADFGIAAQVPKSGLLPSTPVGSLPYMAPELCTISKPEYDPYQADGILISTPDPTHPNSNPNFD
eukprot:TRINITY_DN5726_c0_g1_i3.p1 TRINITY_DN5726_c0_g1~~TRINITY_DN5726_c0_g1_i3.p1  ORF type:complete len:932 (+),score=181.95 TRINITY_DN5726_c0_g1_i3:206-2797(+)